MPVVGERVAATALEVEQARQSAVESGRSSRESIEDLAVLVGIAVGVIPSITLLGFYLPHRIALRREPPARPATR